MKKYIGNYEVVAELGRGGMGVVYKAREESLQRFVAIKMLGNQLVDNESLALRFMREARAVADLNHPNLVQVFRVDRHEDQPYFVMEYVEGESLKRLIQREDKMQPIRALQILKEVATGLAAAHDKGVIHRDIKPENIMLTRYGGVKVVDFGIARVEEVGTRLTTTGIGLGTPSYLSPEVCLSRDVDQRSDIFSLGVVLFEMLTGETPFKSDSPFELMTKVVEARIPDIKGLNPNVDEGVKQILAKMIAKRPKLRYQNCNELIADIEDYQAGRVPRLARNMPLETEPVESESSNGGGATEETEVRALADGNAADTVQIAERDVDSTPADSMALGTGTDSGTHGGKGGRLALAAVLLLLVAGSAIAGSWYLFSEPDRSIWAMFDSPAEDEAPTNRHSPIDPQKREAPAVRRSAATMESTERAGGSTFETDSGVSQLSAAPARGDASPEVEALASSDAGMQSDPDAGFGFVVEESPSGSGPDLSGDGKESLASRAVATLSAGDEDAGSGIDVAASESGTVARSQDRAEADSAPVDRTTDTMIDTAMSADSETGFGEEEALAQAMARPGESSGETLAASGAMQLVETAAGASQSVAVVVVGDTAVAGGVAREFKQALRGASFDVTDERMIEGLVYAESLAGVARTVGDAGVGALVYVEVVPTGERLLEFYGRQELQYMATLEVRVVDLSTRRNLGPMVAGKLEYVTLNAVREAHQVAAPLARNVVNRLRAWRAMRGGPDPG